jgi:hypothetical protein
MTEKKPTNPFVNALHQAKKNQTPKFDPKGFKGPKPSKGFSSNVVRRSGRGG